MRATFSRGWNPWFGACVALLSIVSLLLLAFGFPVLPSIAAAAAPPVVTITMGDDLRFSPASVTIKPGTRVRWVNRSFTRHTVTADLSKAARPADVALPKGGKPFDSSLTPRSKLAIAPWVWSP